MPALRFFSVIKIIGVNPYVLISAARAKQLRANWKKPMPVLLRINRMPEKPWHINMMPRGNGSFYLYLHGSVRKSSASKVGDRVEVEVSFDEQYKGGPKPLPVWFRSALRQNKAALASWKSLSPSRKKEIVRYLLNLKSAEARERNLAKTIHALSGSRMQFMGRAWKDGK